MCNAEDTITECEHVSNANSDSASDAGNDTDSWDESESGSDWDDENHDIIRAKWQIDGSNTLDECVEKLQNFITRIQALKAAGWELARTVDDDYGFIRRNPPLFITQVTTNNN